MGRMSIVRIYRKKCHTSHYVGTIRSKERVESIIRKTNMTDAHVVLS